LFCVAGAGISHWFRAAAELRQGLPFLEIKIVTEQDYGFFAETIFGTDRESIPKGVIEVPL
jgi:hypothetical protein